MKRRKAIFLTMPFIFLSIFSLFAFRVYATGGYDEQYLNAGIPTGYYDSLDLTKDALEFKEDLSVIISTGYKRRSYASLRDLYPISDADPEHPGNVICLYTKNSLDGSSAAAGGWDREHVWAKSHGFPTGKTFVDANDKEVKYDNTDPFSDAHHLRPATSKINQGRLDYDFAELDETVVTDCKVDAYGNKISDSLRLFEPSDACKGDVARMLFYMDTRYGFTYPFYLKLVDDTHTLGSEGNGRVGNLQTLIKWHYEDPVDTSEIYRNNVIYATWQNNRNPYIDHPEYVDIAYPNSYSSNSVVQDDVTAVINLINKIPELVTIKDENTILEAKATYDALNDVEKDLVTNATKLSNAVQSISTIKENSFISIQTMASLKMTYDENLQPVDVDLRFGAVIAKKHYYTGAKYGVLVTTDWKNYVTSCYYNKTTLEDFLSSNNQYQAIYATPIQVSYKDGLWIEDTSGEYYQFAWVINDMEGYYNTSLKAIVFMEYEGDLYLGNPKTYSVVNMAKYYYDHAEELGLSLEHKNVMFNLASKGQIGGNLPGDKEEEFWS